MLEVNDWIILNTITYKIAAIEDLGEMRLAIMNQLKYLIDFDSSSFYTILSKDTNKIGNPVGINYSVEEMNDYIHIFKNVDYSKGLMSTGRNIVYRESDIMNDDERVKTEYYNKVYSTHNWHYSLHLNLSYNENFLGVMSFFRLKGKPNFDYDCSFILDMIKDHLALRLYKDIYRNDDNLLSISECAEKYNITPKELKILSLLIDGNEDKEICQILFITNNTLKKHILNIYRKLGINKRVQLFKMLKTD